MGYVTIPVCEVEESIKKWNAICDNVNWKKKNSYKAEWIAECSLYKIRVEVHTPMFIINGMDT